MGGGAPAAAALLGPAVEPLSPPVAVGRAQPKDMQRGLGRTATGAAWAGPDGSRQSRCRCAARARIVRPSERRAHCAAGGGGRAGAHLPSAALIGVLPEQLRPGRMTPTSRQRPPPGRSWPGFPSLDLPFWWG